jgi:hypothetical protein
MTASPWAAPQNLTPTTGQSDPFGGTGATRWTETTDGGAASHLLNQIPGTPVPVGSWAIASFHFKSSARTCVGIAPNGGGNSAGFDPSTGIVTGTNGTLATQGISGGVEVCRDNPAWSRAWLLYRVTSLAEVRFYVANVGTALTYQGNGSVAMTTFGAQLEAALPDQTTPSPYVASGATSGVGRRDTRQNLQVWSEDYSSGKYIGGTGGGTAGGITDPLGGSTAWAYTWDTSTGWHSYLARDFLGVDPRLAWAFAIWLKVPSGTKTINLVVNNRGGSSVTKAVALTTQWRRFYVSAVAGALASAAGIGTGLLSGSPGDVIHVWGGQLAQTNQMPDYVKTSSAPFNPNGAPRSLVL